VTACNSMASKKIKINFFCKITFLMTAEIK
jgi:hypothetical protein